jgi:hypothetical protein
MFSHIDFPQPSGTSSSYPFKNAQISLLTLPTATPLPKTYPQLNEIHNVLFVYVKAKKIDIKAISQGREAYEATESHRS